MKILSLFDGISCARVALERAGILVDAYYASEIDKYAIQISQKNWIQKTMHVGSVVGLTFKEWQGQPHALTGTGSLGVTIYDTHIDLLIGGSPCQDLSIAKKDRKGLDGERSSLFWEYVRILREVKPKYFILENVASMPKEAKEIITRELGVDPIMINASLVSAQNRKRLFFCGQIRERLYFNDVLCYNCLQDENKGILGKTQNKGTEKILGEAPERCGCVQNMQARIQEDRQERNNEDLLIGMSNNKQEKQRQESQQGNQSKVSENVSKEKQRETTRISKEISPIGSGKGENENCGQKTTPNSCEKDEVSLSKRNNRNKKENYERGSLGDTKYETDMFCVSCHKRLNNRPYRSFISGWNEQPRKSPSVMSEMQFNEARQNNGRVFDIYQLEIPQPEDRGILLKDILESNVDEKYNVSLRHTQAMINTRKSKKLNIPEENGKSGTITASYYKIPNDGVYIKRIGQIGKGGQGDRIYSPDGKSVGLSALGGGRGAKTGLYAVEDKSYCVPSTYYKENVKSLIQRKKKGLMVNENTTIRKLTPIECERLQGLPDNYTEGVSNTQRYKALGNAFNVDVVAHIIRFLKQ